jgi:hypothetical protein
MSILQVDMNRPGGTQRQLPSDETTTFVGNVLSMSSSALRAHGHVIQQLHDSDTQNNNSNKRLSYVTSSTDGRTDEGESPGSLGVLPVGAGPCTGMQRHVDGKKGTQKMV